jgi:hypothetical protein
MMQAYARLKSILEEQDFTITELWELLTRSHIRVGQRSLSPLMNESTPLERLDMHLANAICTACEVSLSDLIVLRPQKSGFQHISLVQQRARFNDQQHEVTTEIRFIPPTGTPLKRILHVETSGQTKT